VPENLLEMCGLRPCDTQPNWIRVCTKIPKWLCRLDLRINAENYPWTNSLSVGQIQKTVQHGQCPVWVLQRGCSQLPAVFICASNHRWTCKAVYHSFACFCHVLPVSFNYPKCLPFPQVTTNARYRLNLTSLMCIRVKSSYSLMILISWNIIITFC
jgi:hypothetical protein